MLLASVSGFRSAQGSQALWFGRNPHLAAVAPKPEDATAVLSKRPTRHHPADSDSELDELFRSSLDEFTRLNPKPAKLEPVEASRSFQACIQETLTRLRESWAIPPQESVLGINPRKREVAKQIADWIQSTLKSENAQVAIVARQGGLQHKKYDKTGMLHTGIAMYHPREQQWKIYNLVDRPMMGQSVCDVQWAEPEDFFAQQGGYKKDALVMLPSPAVQQRMQKALLNGDYRKLVFTPDYNLVSAPDSATSLNCNKWVLLNVLAAKNDHYEPKKLLKEIRENYRPGQIDVHPIVRLFAAQQPKIKASEVPWIAPIQTVTVESLFNSGLFEKSHFCEPRA